MLSRDAFEPLEPAPRRPRQVKRLPERLFAIGVDIGQKRDPTAIAVAEIEYRPTADAERGRSEKESHYIARFLERCRSGRLTQRSRDGLAKSVKGCLSAADGGRRSSSTPLA